jgi:succinoglycan biosynthesis transport protein ExoP
MRLSQLLRILWVHRSMGLSIMALMLAIAVAASLLLPKKYTGESAVVVDARSIDPLGQQGAMTTQLASTYVSTQVDVIESHNVALKVVDRMKLTTDPEIMAKFQ